LRSAPVGWLGRETGHNDGPATTMETGRNGFFRIASWFLLPDSRWSVMLGVVGWCRVRAVTQLLQLISACGGDDVVYRHLETGQ